MHSDVPCAVRGVPASLLHLWAVADDDTLLVAVSRPVGQHTRHATDLVGVQRRIDLQPTHAMQSFKVYQGVQGLLRAGNPVPGISTPGVTLLLVKLFS